MFQEAWLDTCPAILLLVSPEGRRVEVVTSLETSNRVSELTCSGVVAELTAFFGRSDFVGGIGLLPSVRRRGNRRRRPFPIGSRAETS